MAAIVHEERAPHSIYIKLFLALALIYLGSAILFSGVKGSAAESERYIVYIVSALVVLALWSFFNMHFLLSTEGVEAKMPPFSYGIRYSEIEAVGVERVPWWIGWGLRLWWRRIGFISRHGPAVVIKKKGGFFRTLILSSEDPMRMAALIKAEMEKY